MSVVADLLHTWADWAPLGNFLLLLFVLGVLWTMSRRR